MLDILEQRKVTFEDFYNSIDLDRSSSILLSELTTFLSGLSSMFFEKEIHVIHKFFDIDADGTIQKQEFMA